MQQSSIRIILLTIYLLQTSLSLSQIQDLIMTYKPDKQTGNQECKNRYRISNRIEYVDICYENSNNLIQGSISLVLKNTFKADDSENCYRYFDKLALISEEQPHPSNKQYNEIYQNGSKIIKIVTNLLQNGLNNLQPKFNQNIKWLALQEFDISFCENIQQRSYQLISLSFHNRTTLKNNAAGEISKKLFGKGFHQFANYTIKINDLYDINTEQCSIVISEVLPQSTYIDYDQLYGILGSPPQTLQLISVQTPAYLAKQFLYQIEIPLSDWSESDVNTYVYSQPIHFRYPRPSQSQDYQLIKLHPFTSVKISCKQQIHKYVLIEDYLINKGVASIPVGNPKDLKLVSTITLIAEVICAALLMKKIKK